ncbi:phosphopentomutase [Streptococcus suis]|nr:phosphopentomutase [Streptococcus suis]
MRYGLLLRGINVGGRNKVVMAELRQAVADLGYDKVETYINSGNLFFDSTKNRGDIVAEFQTFFTESCPLGR